MAARKIGRRKPPLRPKRPTGRPSSFSEEVAAQICEELMAGRSLREICRDPGMPGARTVFGWLARNESFQQQYARARETQADWLKEELLEIADDSRNDFVAKLRDDGSTDVVIDHEHIQRAKLRIDTRKWLMSKLAPKKYGDRIATEVSGPDGGPIQTESTVVEPFGADLLEKRFLEVSRRREEARKNAEGATNTPTPKGNP
jgi:hypothetical protein